MAVVARIAACLLLLAVLAAGEGLAHTQAQALARNSRDEPNVVRNEYFVVEFNEGRSLAGNSTSNSTGTSKPTKAPTTPAYTKDYGYNLLVAHTVLAVVSWGFLVPIAILIPVIPFYRLKGKWLKMHERLLFISMVLGTIAFLLALFKRAMEKQTLAGVLKGEHGPTGIVLFIGGWLQSVAGTYRAKIYKILGNKSIVRKTFQWGHIMLGRALFVIIWANFYYGWQHLKPTGGVAQVRVFAWVECIATPIIWFIAFLYFRRKLRLIRDAKKKKKVGNKQPSDPSSSAPSALATDGSQSTLTAVAEADAPTRTPTPEIIEDPNHIIQVASVVSTSGASTESPEQSKSSNDNPIATTASPVTVEGHVLTTV